MAYIAPDSTINLYSGVQIIPGRQLAFSSKANQNAYFASKLTQSYTPCTYVRRTNSVKTEVSMAVVKGCNYISFTNPSFENITWYAKIRNYEYVNNGCTEIFYDIDYFQTFMFDVSFETCTIDREQLSVTDYDRSVANPYDARVVELRTAEDISVPDEIFDFPSMINGNRSYLPAGYEDSSYEKQADNIMLYTIIVSSPITTFKTKSTSNNELDTCSGTFSDEDLKTIFTMAGYANLVTQGQGNLPLGSSIPRWRRNEAPAGAPNYCGISYVYWNTSDNTKSKTYLSFGMNRNGVDNQTMIIATSDYYSMQFILGVFAKNDAVSSIVGCYKLPLSFLLMLHAQTFDADDTENRVKISYTPLDTTNRIPDGTSLNDTQNHITVFKENVIPKGFNEVQNKKLLTFPYQYIRVTAPNGTKKEFKFENFTAIQDNTSGGGTAAEFVAQFTLLADLTSTPMLEMYPYMYKLRAGGSNAELMSFRHKLNVEERMEYTDFPQQAYMTDAYLSYVSQQYANQVRNEPMQGFDTESDREIIPYMRDFAEYNAKASVYNATGSMLGSIASPVVDLASGNIPTIGSVIGAANAPARAGNMVNQAAITHHTAERAINTREREINLREEALNWGSTGEIGTSLVAAKSAFRMNNYKAGGGCGTLPYFTNGFRFTFDVMKLKPAFLQKFDEYFTNYGYKSTRTGVPHIATYLAGTKTGDAPKFLQNGQGYYVTYIKTVDCKVFSNLDLVTDFFETLFNMGIQLIDGDTLIQ